MQFAISQEVLNLINVIYEPIWTMGISVAHPQILTGNYVTIGFAFLSSLTAFFFLHKDWVP
jgi:hypothetical protein